MGGSEQWRIVFPVLTLLGCPLPTLDVCTANFSQMRYYSDRLAITVCKITPLCAVTRKAP